MSTQKIKSSSRDRKRAKIRAVISGTADMPRLSVFKSNTRVYAQLIDDDAGKPLVAASGEKAETVGKEIAESAKAKKITSAVFDRGGYIYTGKIKIIAESARKAGLKF